MSRPDVVSTPLPGGAHCSRCHSACDVASGLEATPSPGMPVICFQCGAINVFDDDLGIRASTPADFDAWPDAFRLQVRTLSAAVARWRASRN